MENIALAGLTTVSCRLKVDCTRGKLLYEKFDDIEKSRKSEALLNTG
jgi:hypothetical protein